MIWRCRIHSEIAEADAQAVVCPDCGTLLTELRQFWLRVWSGSSESADLSLCPVCGWWRALVHNSSEQSYERGSEWETCETLAVCLGALADPAEWERTPEELAKLASVHPRVIAGLALTMLEELVRRAFREKGYLTQNLRPGHVPRIGIWEDSSLRRLGLLVSHDGEDVTAEVLGTFVRALAEQGLAEGALVTSSRFSAECAVASPEQKGLVRAQLVDGQRFAELLEEFRAEAGADLRALIEATPTARKRLSQTSRFRN